MSVTTTSMRFLTGLICSETGDDILKGLLRWDLSFVHRDNTTNCLLTVSDFRFLTHHLQPPITHKYQTTEMSTSTATTTVHLKAIYTSPSNPNPQTLSSTPLSLALSLCHSCSQPTTTQSSVETKTAFLRTLRAATTALQDTINADLTARMEQDATNSQHTGSGSTRTTQEGASAAINEVAEEENYGEEAPEEEDQV
ncbi:hypothetical protein F5Y12DRAFT_714641 [Xylaria sp. FL1777]|nr:hypothetical protein F5Y12DRAFT_714641 [Xylaria sp. FL1777]